jgi:hypothetical protein
MVPGQNKCTIMGIGCHLGQSLSLLYSRLTVINITMFFLLVYIYKKATLCSYKLYKSIPTAMCKDICQNKCIISIVQVVLSMGGGVILHGGWKMKHDPRNNRHKYWFTAKELAIRLLSNAFQCVHFFFFYHGRQNTYSRLTENREIIPPTTKSTLCYSSLFFVINRAEETFLMQQLDK